MLQRNKTFLTPILLQFDLLNIDFIDLCIPYRFLFILLITSLL